MHVLKLTLPYSAKFWRGKTLANRSFYTFGEENVGELTIANNIISYFSESGIWLGKILANDVQFAKFAKVFPRQNFALYGITSTKCGNITFKWSKRDAINREVRINSNTIK